jgi:hypothetical protein
LPVTSSFDQHVLTRCLLAFCFCIFFIFFAMSSAQPAIYRLKAQTQPYDWGKLGDISKVAEYARASGSEIDSSKPYAEASW